MAQAKLEQEMRMMRDEFEALVLSNEKLRIENERLRTQQEITEMKRKMEQGPKTSTPLSMDEYQERCDDYHHTSRPMPKLHRADHLDEQTTLKKTSSPENKRTTIMKPATYDGTGSWTDYKAHFQACAELNKWSYAEKGLYLSVSLRGQAQGVFGNIASKSSDYDGLVKALEERFAPPNQTELYRIQLKDRRQKASESMAELGQDIRRLANLAYPSAPADVRETLAKEQFVDALVNSEMRLKIKQARPSDLNDAVRHAVELEAFFRAEKRFGASTVALAKPEQAPEIKDLRKLVEDLQKTVDSLKKQQQRPTPNNPRPMPNYDRRQYVQDRHNSGQQAWREPPRRNTFSNKRTCFTCGSDKHLQYDCPNLKPQNPESVRPGNKPNIKSVQHQMAGLYTQATIEGRDVSCLIDTGATLSLMSAKIWEQLKRNLPLEEYNDTIISASGDQIKILGRTNVTLVFAQKQCRFDLVVAQADCDIILGLDFMKQHHVTIDVESQSCQIDGQDTQLNCSGRIGCYRVVVSKKVEVPQRSEMIISGKMIDTPDLGTTMGLLEPASRFTDVKNGMVARALVKFGDELPIRYANMTEDPVTLYPGTTIATISQVKDVAGEVSGENNKPLPAPRIGVPAHLEDLFERTTHDMTIVQKKQVASLLNKYQGVFSTSDNDIGRTGIIKHQIPTGDATPIRQPMRRVPYHQQKEVDRQIQTMLENDVIQESTSPWSSGIVLVEKKDGTRRFCIDYRRLNHVTIKDAYPLPRIDESLDQLSGSKWFSCLDLSSGYWQVEVEDADRPKTAFVTRGGLYEYKVMPFGLCNAPATFERLIETVMAGLHWKICLIYLDDIIVVGKTFEDMINNLDKVLGRLAEYSLKLKPRKCQLFRAEVEYLGHLISKDGIKTDPKKTECIQNWPEPKCVKDIRSFLGLCSYYRRFIYKHAEIAKPLHQLTEKNRQFVWTKECSNAFIALKDALVSAPVLSYPDFTQPFILDTDASDFAVAAVLSQTIDGQERPIAYASRSLNKCERKYCVTRKELLAVVNYVKYFKHYLYGKKFLIRTDHSSLRWLTNFRNPEGQVARWLETLSSYSFTIEHRKGRLHGNADGLSRIPCRQCGRDESIETHMEIDTGTTIPNQLNQLGPEKQLDIQTYQDEDRDISLVRQWVVEGKRPNRQDISAEGYVVKTLWTMYSQLEVTGGVLVRRQERPGTEEYVFQAIVPLSQRREVLHYCHDVRTAGHLGIRKTLQRIKLKFYWPRIKQDVRVYVTGCKVCLKRKGPMKTKKAPMQLQRSGYPMERIAVDILGELPRTENGNRYVLVVADYFSKWTESFPMPNMEASTVAKIMVEEVISRFGVPAKIHSDQGRQFESRLFQEMCQLLGIDKTRTTAYHPQSDGMVERFNRTLASMISAFVDENHKDWDSQLPYVMMAYRSSEHETTGMSPNRLMLGREVSTPLDIMYELPALEKQIPDNQWVWEMQDRMERAHTFVRKHTEQEMQRQKQLHDRHVSYEQFEKDESVLVYFPVRKVGTSSKFTSFWKGPFKIISRVSDVLYKVDCGREQADQVVHCDRLRKCKSQVLNNETNTENELANVDHVVPEEIVKTSRSGRTIREPVWAKDYEHVFTIFRMPNTKGTERNRTVTCPICKEDIRSEDFASHVMRCNKGTPRLPCSYCSTTFLKKSYLARHIKLKHSEYEKETERRDDDESSDWDSEPDVDIAEGRTIRKRTCPEPVFSPRKKVTTAPEPASSPEADSRETPSRPIPDAVPETASTNRLQIASPQRTTGSDELHECSSCNIKFGDIGCAVMHKTLHGQQGLFVCNVCKKDCLSSVGFMTHWNFEKHC